MKLKYAFEMMQLDDHIVAIPTGEGAENYHGVVKLNETGTFIFGLLKQDTAEDDIINALAKEYNMPQKEIADDVRAYIDEFREKGFLEE